MGAIRLVRDAVVVVTLLLILTGLSNAAGGTLSGNVLHVWSHDMGSSYTEIHNVNRGIKKDTYAIEQTVLAKNYSGSAGVTLLEVQVTDGGRTRWYSVYWYGGNSVDVFGKTVNLDMSVPHTYRIEVTRNNVKFYIDGGRVKTIKKRHITKIQQVNAGRWDKGSTYDLYIDDVREYWNGDVIAQENFDDGSDDFYTSDVPRGSGDSGEEIIQSEGVPEFPFLEPVIDEVMKVLNL